VAAAGGLGRENLPDRVRRADRPVRRRSGRGRLEESCRAFLQGLRELGYVDGKNIKFDFYSIEGKFGQIDEIATRVLATSPDVVLAAGGGANEVAHAFQRMTRTVPIVLANSSDPAAQGLVASLGHPGGNITGFAGNTGPEFEAKRLQLLREAAPHATRVAYLGLKLDWESPAAMGVRNAAAGLGITLLHAEHKPSNYDDAFALIAREQMQGLFVARNPWNFSNRRAIAGLLWIGGWRQCTRRASSPRLAA
jgi:putative tryptophan/tyrosine transport system substrate-binding protein